MEKPDSLNPRLQTKAKLLSDRLFDRRKELGKALGEPLKGGQLSSSMKKQRYTDLISSQGMLFNALAGAAIVGRTGELRLSTKMVEAFVELRGK